MDNEKTVLEWKPYIEPVLDSKTNEFLLMGYSQASKEEIWDCLMEKVWQGNVRKRLHEIVQDIFHLQSNLYMSYLTVKAYQDDDLLSSIQALTNNENKDE